MRLFIAADLPGEMKLQISTLVEKFRSRTRSVKWVREENVHITLYFLGEVAESDIEELIGIIESAISGMSQFFTKVGEISAFPSPTRPRVLWVGVDDPQKGLTNAYSAICDTLHNSDLEMHREKKDYTPHITIGRVKGRFDRNIEHILHTYQNQMFGEVHIKELVLFRSILQREGPRYVQVRIFPFHS
jgi:2'-5' RNA ligase